MSKLSDHVRALKRVARIGQRRVKGRLQGMDSLKDDARFPSGAMGYHYVSSVSEQDRSQAFHHLRKSKSQYGQDLFVLAELEHKRDGYFVEFGATDGIRLSNTHLLEKEFGWTGLLSEPAHCWHKDLQTARRCVVDNRCVWSVSGETLEFTESSKEMLSTISKFAEGDHHKRDTARTYNVETISLIDLLKENNAPRQIDYLSVDTEGSEFEILSTFDFNAYDIGIITCEHNFTDSRDRIFELLTSAGYARKFDDKSGMDDWYVKRG